MTNGATATGLVAILARFTGQQFVVQVLSMVTGILIVRTLDREDFAAYSLVVAVVSGCGLVAHSGLASTIFARGAQVRASRMQLSRLVVTTLGYRKRVTIVLSLIGSVVLAVLLIRIQTPPMTAVMLVAVGALTVCASAPVAVLNELLALEYRRSEMQRASMAAAFLRVVGQVGLGMARTSTSVTAGLLTCLATLLQWRLQKKAVRELVDLQASPDEEELTRVRSSFSALFPANLLLVVQAQLVVLILAVLGHGGTVADLGAVSRFALIFSVLGAVVNGVLVPMAARVDESQAVRAYLGVCAVVVAIGTAALIVAFLATKPLLALLGPQYTGLSDVFRIVFAAATLAVLGDAMSSLNQARGWLTYAWVPLPIAVLTIAVMVTFVDVGNAVGAAWLAAAMVVPGVAAQFVQFCAGLKAMRRREAPHAEVVVSNAA